MTPFSWQGQLIPRMILWNHPNSRCNLQSQDNSSKYIFWRHVTTRLLFTCNILRSWWQQTRVRILRSSWGLHLHVTLSRRQCQATIPKLKPLLLPHSKTMLTSMFLSLSPPYFGLECWHWITKNEMTFPWAYHQPLSKIIQLQPPTQSRLGTWNVLNHDSHKRRHCR